jgi:hypothetical protein
LTGEESTFTHGNTGCAPVNRLSQPLIEQIRKLIDKYSWFDPGKRSKDGLNLRRPTNELAEGWNGLWTLFKRDFGWAAKQMDEITFKRHAKNLLAEEFCKMLGVAKDHNVCSVCKLVSTQMLTWHERTEGYRQQRDEYAPEKPGEDATKYAEYEQKRAEAQAEHDRLKEILTKHGARNIMLRAFVNRLVAVAVGCRDAGIEQAMVVHNDDKTAAQVPLAAMDTGKNLAKDPVEVHGEGDLVDHTMSFYITEPGAGSKDTNMTLDFIMLNIIARKRAGHKVLVLVSDCGPHQHNQWMVDFIQFLRDKKFFTMVLGVFLGK